MSSCHQLFHGAVSFFTVIANTGQSSHSYLGSKIWNNPHSDLKSVKIVKTLSIRSRTNSLNTSRIKKIVPIDSIKFLKTVENSPSTILKMQHFSQLLRQKMFFVPL